MNKLYPFIFILALLYIATDAKAEGLVIITPVPPIESPKPEGCGKDCETHRFSFIEMLSV